MKNLRTLSVAVALGLLLVIGSLTAAEKPMNVIFILADDLGFPFIELSREIEQFAAELREIKGKLGG